MSRISKQGLDEGTLGASALPTAADGQRRSLAGHALLLLPLLLPFEAPLFSVGPLVITSAELGLYLVLGAWAGALGVAAARAAGRGGWRAAAARVHGALGLGADDGIGRAVVLWLAVVVVSALAAPAHRAAALKFALRTTSGVLLFFAARDLVRSAADARRLTAAVVAGAALSAGAALLERALPGADSLWRPFRPVTFDTLGLPRASGAFAYPTIAAMYNEAALPLALAIPAAWGAAAAGARRARGAVGVALALALAALLVAALLLSATRTALAGAVVASGAMLVLGWRAGARVRVTAAGALALVGLAVASTFVISPGGANSDMARRLRFWRDTSWYAVRYAFDAEHLTMRAGADRTVAVRLRNTGDLGWAHAGPSSVLLGYHWEIPRAGANGPRVALEGRRTALPADVPPGGELRVDAAVEAPDEPGRYRLRWDLVREQMTWFSERGSDTGDQTVDVVEVDAETHAGTRSGGAGARARPSHALRPGTVEDALTPVEPTRLELWRAALILWRRHPLLGVGPDNFRRMYPGAIRPARGERPYADERLHANNFYLETLADLGLAGAAALGLLALALARAIRARARAARAGRGGDGGDGDSLLALAWGVAAATFFVHGLLDYFLEFTPTYGLYWLSIALAVGGLRAASSSRGPADSTP